MTKFWEATERLSKWYLTYHTSVKIILLVEEQLLLFLFSKIEKVFRVCFLELLMGKIYSELDFSSKYATLFGAAYEQTTPERA